MHYSTLVHELAQTLLPLYENAATATDNAWWMLQAITGCTKAELIVKKNITLSVAQKEQLAQWIDTLVREQVPLQYLLGTVPFLELNIIVKPPILIPRPETEAWVATLIEALRHDKKNPHAILDLCTGSGCIGLALATAFPHSIVSAVDNNPEALALAQENAHRHIVKNIQFYFSDLYTAIPHVTYDLIVANPPYVSEQEWHELAPQIKLWEDRGALVAHDQGYGLIEKIITQAPHHMANQAQLYIEIGHTQGNRVAECFTRSGFENVEIFHDLQGKERVVKGIWNAHSPNYR